MIAAHKGEFPFAVLIIPFITGIACRLNFISPAYSVLLTVTLVLLGVIFILLNINYRYFNIYKHKWLGGLFIHLLLFFIGWVSVINYNELSAKKHFSKNSAEYLVVQINNEPGLLPKLKKMYLKAAKLHQAVTC
jgi:competence protein ComEC